MRFLLIILLLANIALFVYARSNNTPPASQQLQPVAADKVVLVKSLAEGEALPTASSSPTPSSSPAPTQAPTASCFEWGPVAESQLDNARAALNRIPNLGAFQENRHQSPAKSWLVSIDGIATHAAAVNRVNELRRLGFSDISVMEPGPETGATFALSLGVFSSEQGALSRLASLNEKKIVGVKATPRGVVTTVSFVVTSTSPETEQRLRDLPSRFIDSALHSAACPPPS
ncbi:MAG: hypothetical protein FWF41_03565 [Betaproteobacteria bacterium]|nr:hypothetical protein [Betaproteobacteria bacterium]